MKTLIILFASTLLISKGLSQTDKYTLTGNVTGFEDSTLLVMRDMETELETDSAYIIDGVFSFKGQVSEPTQVSLMTKTNNRSDFAYTFIWLEPTDMTLTSTKSDFRYADVDGSKVQDQYEEYLAIKKPFVNQRDSINNVARSIKDPDSLTIASIREAHNNIRKQSQAAELQFIEDHPNYLVAASQLSWIVKNIPETISKKNVKALYNNFTPEITATKYAEAIKYYLDHVKLYDALEIGDKPYDFALPDSSGNKVALSSLKDKIILLDFWASGCGPCRWEHKNYVKAYEQYNEKGFEIFSVSQDTREDMWKKAMKKDNMTWTSVHDQNKEISNYMYRVSYIPKNYLIDQSGKIIATDLRGDKLINKLKALIDE